MKTSRTLALALGLGVMLLPGCAVGPNYSRPSVAAPTTWKETSVTTRAAVLPTEWWAIFNDADLDALERQAVEAKLQILAIFSTTS